MADAFLRVAAVLFAFIDLTFGPGAIYTMRHVALHGTKPVLFGIPAFGGGPFDRFGTTATLVLLGGFVLLSVLEFVASVLVWGGHKAGAWLGLALLLPGLVAWVGFSLPIPPIFAAARAALLLWRWDALA